MAFKDLLVHVSCSKPCAQRPKVAAHLARAFDTHLAGLHTAPAVDVPALMTASAI